MSDPSQTKNFENRYDNSDMKADRRAKDIAAAYTEYDEMRAYKMYLEALETEARVAQSTDKVKTKVIKANGQVDEKEIEIKDLVPQQSEFEQARRRVIVKLNALSVADTKRLFAEFETESVWELSSKITNFILDKARRDRVADGFKLY